MTWIIEFTSIGKSLESSSAVVILFKIDFFHLFIFKILTQKTLELLLGKMVIKKDMNRKEIKTDRIYFFYGPESYLIDLEVQKLIDKALSPKERGLNLQIFDPQERDINEIIQTAKTLPMFSRFRFILINDADLIPEEDIEVFINYFKNPSPTTFMVLRGKELGNWKSYISKIENLIYIKEYQRLRGRSLLLWMISRMEEKGKILPELVAQYIADLVGNNLQDIENVLEKVFLSSVNKKRIEMSDLEGIVSDIKVNTIFDLMEAIGRKDLDNALKILDKALESRSISFKKEGGAKRFDDPSPLILDMMARQYWNMLEIKKVSQNVNRIEELKERLAISAWAVKKLLEQERNFSESSLLEGLLNCHKIDLAIKRGRVKKELLMEKLMIDLCRQ